MKERDVLAEKVEKEKHSSSPPVLISCSVNDISDLFLVVLEDGYGDSWGEAMKIEV